MWGIRRHQPEVKPLYFCRLQRCEIFAQTRVAEPFAKQIVEAFIAVSCLCQLQRADIREPVLGAVRRWVDSHATNENQEFHQKARGASVTIVERVDRHQSRVRSKGRFGCIRRCAKPTREIPARRGNLNRRRETSIAARFPFGRNAQDFPAYCPGDIGLRPPVL